MSKITDTREALMVGRRTDGSLVRRPLSPHLQAYDMMQMTSALSITHRITGALWSVGMVFLVWWLVAAAAGEASYNAAQWFFGSFIGVIGLMGLTAVAWYHTLAGIRHLWMDVSHTAVNKEFGKSSAIATLFLSIVLTAVLGAKLFGLY